MPEQGRGFFTRRLVIIFILCGGVFILGWQMLRLPFLENLFEYTEVVKETSPSPSPSSTSPTPGGGLVLFPLCLGVEVAISTNMANDLHPDIFGDKIVWQRHQSTILYDLDTGDESIPLAGLQNTWNTASPRIFEDYLAFNHGPGPPAPSQLGLYNLSTGNHVSVDIPNWVHTPDLYSGTRTRVVLEADHTNSSTGNTDNNEVYLYDLEDDLLTRITNDANVQELARIYGDRVVWTDYRHGHGEPYMYDISTGETTRLQNDDYNDVTLYPAISEDWVAWGRRNEVMLYDLAEQTLTPITGSAADWPVDFDIYDDKIVWGDRRSGDNDVYLYDITKRLQLRVTDKPKSQRNPSIYENKIVWQDKRNGNWDIYMNEIVACD